MHAQTGPWRYFEDAEFDADGRCINPGREIFPHQPPNDALERLKAAARTWANLAAIPDPTSLELRKESGAKLMLEDAARAFAASEDERK